MTDIDITLDEALNVKPMDNIREIKTYMEGIVRKYLPDYKVIWSERLVKSDGICYWKTNTISFKFSAILEVASDWNSGDHDYLKSYLTLLVLHEVAHGIWKKERKKYEVVHGKRFQTIAHDLLKKEDLEMFVEFAGYTLKSHYYTGKYYGKYYIPEDGTDE